jgi:hypothetical protein
MTPKLPRNTRKQRSKKPAQNGRRQTPQLTYTDAEKPQSNHSLASEKLWAAIKITDDNGTHYRIRCASTDPATGALYKPTWEPHHFVTPDLEAEWKETIVARDGVAGHIGHDGINTLYTERNTRSATLYRYDIYRIVDSMWVQSRLVEGGLVGRRVP